MTAKTFERGAPALDHFSYILFQQPAFRILVRIAEREPFQGVTLVWCWPCVFGKSAVALAVLGF